MRAAERLVELLSGRNTVSFAISVHKFEQWRVTLCPRALLEARQVVMYAPAADKAAALRQVREGPM